MLEKKTYNLYCGNEQIGYFNLAERKEDITVDLFDGLNHLNMPIDFWREYDNGDRHFDWKLVKGFVVDRVVPSSRQNISGILKRVGIEEYDPLAIFLYAHGHFNSDQFHIEEA